MLFTILAAIVAIIGVVQLLQGQILLGIVLIVVAFALGPGGWSLTRRRNR